MKQPGCTDAVEQYVVEEQPVEQDRLVEEFGNRGLVALRYLMEKNKVSYTLDWKLTHE
jgi:hypothetical protein